MGAFWERGLNVMWELGWDSRFSFCEPCAQGAILSCDKDFIEGKVSYTYTRKILPLLDMNITINLFNSAVIEN
jgi:hypothetical protein